MVGVRRSRRSLPFNDFLDICIEASGDRFAARRARRRCPGLDVTHRGPGLERSAHARRGYRLFQFLVCRLRVEVLEHCWLHSALTIHQRHVASVDHFTQGFSTRRCSSGGSERASTSTRRLRPANARTATGNRCFSTGHPCVEQKGAAGGRRWRPTPRLAEKGAELLVRLFMCPYPRGFKSPNYSQ